MKFHIMNNDPQPFQLVSRMFAAGYLLLNLEIGVVFSEEWIAHEKKLDGFPISFLVIHS